MEWAIWHCHSFFLHISKLKLIAILEWKKAKKGHKSVSLFANSLRQKRMQLMENILQKIMENNGEYPQPPENKVPRARSLGGGAD